MYLPFTRIYLIKLKNNYIYFSKRHLQEIVLKKKYTCGDCIYVLEKCELTLHVYQLTVHASLTQCTLFSTIFMLKNGSKNVEKHMIR